MPPVPTLFATVLALLALPGQDPDPPRAAIGLVPSSDAAVTAALAAGARLALAEAASGGGPVLALEIGDAKGRWSTAAVTAVDLAGRPGVVALISPPERAAAHAVAQVATRAQLPLISTCAAASLTATGSYWVRSVVPRSTTENRDAVVQAPPFDPRSNSPATRRFAAAFRRQEGRDPDGWAAAGYDAARVVTAACIRARMEGTSLQRAFRGLPSLPGATGPLAFDRAGNRIPAAVGSGSENDRNGALEGSSTPLRGELERDP